MTLPKTLLQMAGANPAPPPLGEAALVLIDMQMEYVDGAMPLPGAKPALAAAARLLARMRAAGRPIVHIQHKGRAGGLFDPAGPRFAIAPEVAPRPGETVLTKGLPNSYAGTELDAVLKRLGVSKAIFAGFMTHMCVSSTVRAALDLGYGATVASDACATRDLPDGEGGILAAGALHRAELAALADRFAVVVPERAIGG
jgi:nicotinamidase-related amidase